MSDYNNGYNEHNEHENHEHTGETPAEPIEAEPLRDGNAWSDAGYVPSADATEVPKSYQIGGADRKEKKAKKVREKRRGMPAAAVVALCLVCAIVGGTAVYGLSQFHAGNAAAPAAEPVESATVTASANDSVSTAARHTEYAAEETPAPAVATLGTQSGAVTGAVLTPTEIYYDLAVNQVVGITGSINYNYYGRTYSSVVSGSGFIISEDGYILTNSHVIVDAAESGGDITVLLYDGGEYAATVVGYDEDNDIGVLKIDAEGLMPVAIGDSDELLVGETVYVVGNAMGYLEWSLTSGLVSGKDREITAYGLSNGASETLVTFQTEATINSGNSGGPVYNDRGEVVGVAVASASSSSYAESLNFAIPINTAISIAEDLIDDGVVSKPYLGILNADTLSATYAQYYGVVPGVYFQALEAGGPAEKAGVQVGDIIVGLGGHEIANTSDLESAKKEFHAGDTTTLRVYRSGKYLDLTITLGDLSEATGAAAGAETETETPEETPAPAETRRPDNGSSFYDYFNEFFGGLDPFAR